MTAKELARKIELRREIVFEQVQPLLTFLSSSNFVGQDCWGVPSKAQAASGQLSKHAANLSINALTASLSPI